MNKDILGYDQTIDGAWEPVYECKPDYIYSAAVVHCQQCGEFIRGMGGPLNALCLKCYTVNGK